MKIAMANDHAGTALKNQIKEWLEAQGHEVVDFGTYDEEGCDLSDFVSQDPLCAELAREHNDANVLCIGGKIIGSVIAMRIVEVWMSTDPLTAEKYVRRREKVAAIDEECTVQK